MVESIITENGYIKEQNRNNTKATEIIKQTFISEVANQKAGEISYGQQKLLTLACCIANDAELFLLDEPGLLKKRESFLFFNINAVIIL